MAEEQNIEAEAVREPDFSSLVPAEAPLGELEAALQNAELKLEAQAEELKQAEEQRGELQGRLALAAAKYRQLLLSATPEVPQELVKGETVEEVEASFAAARQVVERVRQGLEARWQAERVPAGAPPRRGPDLSTLSPRDKIAYALARK